MDVALSVVNHGILWLQTKLGFGGWTAGASETNEIRATEAYQLRLEREARGMVRASLVLDVLFWVHNKDLGKAPSTLIFCNLLLNIPNVHSNDGKSLGYHYATKAIVGQ